MLPLCEMAREVSQDDRIILSLDCGHGHNMDMHLLKLRKLSGTGDMIIVFAEDPSAVPSFHLVDHL